MKRYRGSYLGLMIRSFDGNLVKEKDLKITEGVYVDSIANNSVDGDAGIEVGDVIPKGNDVVSTSSAKLLEFIGRHHPGDKVILDLSGVEFE